MLRVKCVPYQASLIFAGYCHQPAVLGNLLMAYPLYTDVDDFFEITEGLPLPKKEERKIIQQLNNLTQGLGVWPLEHVGLHFACGHVRKAK